MLSKSIVEEKKIEETIKHSGEDVSLELIKENIKANGLNPENYTKEETQYVIEGDIRVFDSKKWQIDAFVRYSNTINKVDTVGIRFTFKLGLSYEERLIKDLLKRIKKLEEKSK